MNPTPRQTHAALIRQADRWKTLGIEHGWMTHPAAHYAVDRPSSGWKDCGDGFHIAPLVPSQTFTHPAQEGETL